MAKACQFGIVTGTPFAPKVLVTKGFPILGFSKDALAKEGWESDVVGVVIVADNIFWRENEGLYVWWAKLGTDSTGLSYDIIDGVLVACYKIDGWKETLCGVANWGWVFSLSA